MIVVPLTARGVVLGVMSLWRSRRPDPFAADDLTLALELASRAALAIDNARRFAQQGVTLAVVAGVGLPRLDDGIRHDSRPGYGTTCSAAAPMPRARC